MDEDTFDRAMMAIRRWYYGEIRSLADTFAKNIRSGEYGSGERASEKLDEAIHEELREWMDKRRASFPDSDV